jgi:hypothetical protein
MQLRNRITGVVIADSQLRSENPNTSFPEVLTPEIIDAFGYDPVLEGPQAVTIPPYQYSQYDGVVEVRGQWFTHYIAVTPDDKQKAAMDVTQGNFVRTDRNRRLAESDWTQLPDAPADKEIWASYRQELREVTNQAGFPWNITWPEAP